MSVVAITPMQSKYRGTLKRCTINPTATLNATADGMIANVASFVSDSPGFDGPPVRSGSFCIVISPDVHKKSTTPGR
jgi:hypothetical protein